MICTTPIEEEDYPEGWYWVLLPEQFDYDCFTIKVIEKLDGVGGTYLVEGFSPSLCALSEVSRQIVAWAKVEPPEWENHPDLSGYAEYIGAKPRNGETT